MKTVEIATVAALMLISLIPVNCRRRPSHSSDNQPITPSNRPSNLWDKTLVQSQCECVPCERCDEYEGITGPTTLPVQTSVSEKDETTKSGQPDKSSSDGNQCGVLTDSRHFPWSVEIHLKGAGTRDSALHWGSLINTRAVLSLHHPYHDPYNTDEKLMIRTGLIDATEENLARAYPRQTSAVAHLIIHPNYTENMSRFAILILSTSVMLTDNVNVVCLPGRQSPIDESNCLTISNSEECMSNNVKDYQKFAVSLQPSDSCRSINDDEIDAGFDYYTMTETLYTLINETDLANCEVQPVSMPLVCPMRSDSARYVLVGLSRSKMDYGSCNFAYFTNVFTVRDWIDKMLALYLQNKSDPN